MHGRGKAANWNWTGNRLRPVMGRDPRQKREHSHGSIA